MKVREDDVKPVGLTLLYEPDWPIDAAVDIVLVHGIGGHPVRSWKYQYQDEEHIPTTPQLTLPHPGLKRRLTKLPPETSLRRSNSEPLLANQRRPLSRARTSVWKNSAKSSSRVHLDRSSIEPPKQAALDRSKSLLRKASAKSSSSRARPAELAEPTSQGSEPGSNDDAYWPLDFLPASCPNARVFVWGYQAGAGSSKRPRPLQGGDILAHAEELLVELASTRAALGARARPLVFVAHSTGGVLIKELLRRSEAERDGPLKAVLLATSAAVFLGSPHRAPTEHCTLADALRSMAAATTDATARRAGRSLPRQEDRGEEEEELCAALELGRQAFVRLWEGYNFGVKTFQESVVPSYVASPEVRAETTLRRLASFIGDPREKGETVCARHEDVCRFASPEDAGYRALARALAGFVTGEEDGRHVLTTKEADCLSALVQPQDSVPETQPAPSYPGTCLWLYDLPDFQAWLHRNGPNKNKILWIRGEPGCGKTVLLRSLRRRLERQWGPAGASFIWSTAHAVDMTGSLRPHHHDASPAGVYRSLLAQLFLQDPRLRNALVSLYSQPRSDQQAFDDAQVVAFFADYYVNQKVETPARRTFIFVEIEEDACPAYVHELLGRLSHLAHNSDFSICVASGYREEIIEEENVISVPMHLRNADDVLRYVNLNLVAEWEERDQTVLSIGRKAGGVFLWAEIVVNILNAAIIEGATQEMIEYTLEEVPGDLHGLYEWMLSTLNDRERAESLVLFQWVMLAAEPMRLNDLSLAVRLTEPNPFALYEQLGPLMALDIGAPFSMRDLRQLRNSEITSDTPYQFHRWLRARSIGLLELRSDARQPAAKEPLGLQRVQPIHSSVRAFFLSGRGFACLAAGNPSIPAALPLSEFVDITHYALLRACLTYLNMRDFESLGHGAARRRKPPPTTPAAAAVSSPSSSTSPTTTTTPTTATTHTSSSSSTPSSSSSFSPTHTHTHPHHPAINHPLLPYHPPTPAPVSTSTSQRALVTSSYPFLHYAVHHLLHHLLSPSAFRYFLPQRGLLGVLCARRFRLWKRWTALLGVSDAGGILRTHDGGGGGGGGGGLGVQKGEGGGRGIGVDGGGGGGGDPRAVAGLLSPVYGARYRLERVLRKVARLAAAEEYGGSGRRGRAVTGMWEGGAVGEEATTPVTPVATGLKVAAGSADMVGKGQGGGEKGEYGDEQGRDEWVPQTPRFRLPAELSLPLPSAGGSLLSPLKRVGREPEREEVGMETAGHVGVGIAV